MAADSAGHRDGREKARPLGWRFIDLAELGSNTGRAYLAALLRIILYPLAAAVLLGLAAGIDGLLSHRPPGSMGPIVGILGQYGPIVVAGMAVAHSVVRIHRRPWRSLIAPELRIDWRRIAIGGGVELAILSGQLALVHALTGWPWAFSLTAPLPAIALALILIPLQAASEEILFRGYLTQALGRIMRSRVAIAAIVALVFGLLHLNAFGPLTVPYFFVVSLILSLVSLRDDRLELAVGGHWAINFFAFAAANTGVIMPGLAGFDAAPVPFNGAAILVLLANGALFYGLTRLLVRVFCKPRPPL